MQEQRKLKMTRKMYANGECKIAFPEGWWTKSDIKKLKELWFMIDVSYKHIYVINPCMCDRAKFSSDWPTH